MLSIITVVYNDKAGLDKTIQSIKNQHALDINKINFIVIDGGSKDGTLDSIKDNMELINTFLSESDSGIYDAMNKGLSLVKTEWVIFLNAGDVFYSPHTLGNIIESIHTKEEKNFIYGNYRSGHKLFNQELSITFLSAHMINHQSICYHMSLFKNCYDTSYRFCADYSHLLSVYSEIKPKYMAEVLVDFDETGVSSHENNKANMWAERFRAVWSSPLTVHKKVVMSRRAIVAFPYHIIRNWLRNS